jgi:hypothetical protein
MRDIRNWRQVLISTPTGLFCGGTQRTALVTMQSNSASPSSGRASKAPLAKPYFANVP